MTDSKVHGLCCIQSHSLFSLCLTAVGGHLSAQRKLTEKSRSEHIYYKILLQVIYWWNSSAQGSGSEVSCLRTQNGNHWAWPYVQQVCIWVLYYVWIVFYGICINTIYNCKLFQTSNRTMCVLYFVEFV